jgi:hypothetical protein
MLLDPHGNLSLAWQEGEVWPMKDKTDRWLELCVQASIERDPEKMREIAKEIMELLEMKQRRLGIIPLKPPATRC